MAKHDAEHTHHKKRTPGRRFLALASGVLVAWMVISGAAGPLFGKLSSVQKNDSAGFLPESAESTKANNVSITFSKSTDKQVMPALVVWTGSVTPESMAAFANFGKSLPNVVVEAAKKPLSEYLSAENPFLPIPSQDGKAILMSVNFDDKAIGETLPNNKPAFPAVIGAVRTHAATISGFESHVTGIGGILADLFESFGTIDTHLLGITLIVVALILVVVYRSPILWAIPLFSSMIALTVGGAVVYLLAKNGAIDLDGQSQGILSVLVIGAATDYALLLIARYREELHHFDSRVEAMKVAWRGVVEPIFASGMTVIAGLLVLSLSDLKSVRSLGPVAAIGILSAQAVMLTLLPAILVLCGRWIFWPKRPKHDDVDEKMSGIWAKVATGIGHHPRRTWISSTVILLVAAGFATQLNLAGMSQADSFTGRPDSKIGLEVVSKHFPAGAGDPTIVVAPVADVDKLIPALQGVDGVASVTRSLSGPVMPGAPVPAPIDVNGLTQLEVILDKSAGSVEAQDEIPGIRDVAHSISPTSLVGGTTAVAYDIQQTNKHDRNLIIPVALLVIGLILMLLLRSLVAPIILIATTVLSFLATLGVSHLVFTKVFKFAGSDGSFPLFAFVFLVALGIDYNIFLMTRVREEAHKLGTRPGILKGLTVTGGVITSAGIVLAATFGVLGTLPLVALAELGFAVAFGVLLDTVVVRSLLVPALSYDLDARIWWPSELSKETVENDETAAVAAAE